MNSRLFFAAPLVLLIVITGCGGSSGYNFNNVTITVSPATATVSANGQVTLQAMVTGLPGSVPAVFWTIAGLIGSGAQCNWLGTTPPAGPCPNGTIQGAGVPPYTPVTYNAPNTSGTFHVIATWSTAFNPVITKSATSVITVP